MAFYDLPLKPSNASYRFATVIKDVSYIIDVHWNTRESAWYMDWYREDLTEIVLGVKIVLGCYLGRRVDEPPFSEGVLVAVDTSGEGVEAAFDDIGTRVIVRFIPTEDLLILLNRQTAE